MSLQPAGRHISKVTRSQDHPGSARGIGNAISAAEDVQWIVTERSAKAGSYERRLTSARDATGTSAGGMRRHTYRHELGTADEQIAQLGTDAGAGMAPARRALQAA
jgi:hypothetical protein